MIEHTIENNPHSASVRFCHHLAEQFVTGFKIPQIRNAPDVPAGISVILRIFRQQLPVICNKPAKMRVDMVIILRIIFMT